MTAELLANLATAVAALVAFTALVIELRRARQDRELSVFFRYLDHSTPVAPPLPWCARAVINN